MKRALVDWGPAVLWAAVIFLLSSRPSPPETGMDFPGGDKVLHFGGYALLGALLSHGGARRGVSPWLLVLAGALYGISDEFHQSFVPGRDVDVFDWAADCLGTAAGVFTHRRFILPRLTRRGTSSAHGAGYTGT